MANYKLINYLCFGLTVLVVQANFLCLGINITIKTTQAQYFHIVKKMQKQLLLLN